ncbi:MAG TPA: chalcone isomerase family protein [Burkholderiaceae bacterium]|nr:chalcone isomerase family protein [Burkholderiaceae bacterium]
MTTIRRHLLGALMAIACGLPGWAGAQTTEVAGIKFDNNIQLGGTPLVLNGAGVRYKAIFKVYAAALYLPSKTNNPETAISMPGAKRIQLVMLRAVDGNEFGKLLSAGMEKNASKDEFIQSLPGIVRMGEAAARYKQLAVGDTLIFDWVPNVGFTLYVKGRQEVGPYKDPAFYSAMTKIWLGRAPADLLLKESLLGQRDTNQPANSGAN